MTCMLSRFSGVQLCVTPWTVAQPGFSVHEILWARILEWVAISFSRGSSLTQGSNLDLLHCRQMLYCLSCRHLSTGSHFTLVKGCHPGRCFTHPSRCGSRQRSHTIASGRKWEMWGAAVGDVIRLHLNQATAEATAGVESTRKRWRQT